MLKALAFIGAAAVASALLVPTASIASPAREDTDAVSETVSYAGLDLSERADVALLQSRIDHAAARVCEPATFSTEFGDHVRKECMDKAVASAQPQFAALIGAARHGVVIVGAAATLLVTGR